MNAVSRGGHYVICHTTSFSSSVCASAMRIARMCFIAFMEQRARPWAWRRACKVPGARCVFIWMIRALAALAAGFAVCASAQDAYPSRPITVVVPFPPGGVADIVARATGPAMEATLGQPLVVMNKPGAGGTVGTAAVAHAAPDGYTLLMALASISTNPEQERLSGRPPAFELSQLAPIGRISIEPILLAVRANS